VFYCDLDNESNHKPSTVQILVFSTSKTNSLHSADLGRTEVLQETLLSIAFFWDTVSFLLFQKVKVSLEKDMQTWVGSEGIILRFC